MIRIVILSYLLICAQLGTAQNDLLKTPEWNEYFANKMYEKKALHFTDETFWEINDTYTYYQPYPLLLVYSDGTSRMIEWSFEGIDQLIYKKEALTATDFERYEKENIAYMVFDSILFKNPRVGNMVAGDFMIAYKKGPISLFREFYTSPVTRENIQSVLTPYYLGEMVQNFYLGSLKKKLMNLVEDYPRLRKKIKDDIIGYQGQDDDMLRIAEEYNAWTKENYPYRFADHSVFLWQDVGY